MKRYVRPLSARRLVFALLLFAIITGQAAAQTAEPTFVSAAEYAFSQSMSFRLTVSDVAPVDTLTLFFTAPEFPNTFAVDVPFNEGEQIDVIYQVDLNQVRPAPFTTVTYWWVLTAAEGQVITVPKQTIFYEDDRFQWRTISQDGYNVSWTGNDPSIGQLALDIALQASAELRQIIPVEEIAPIQLYVYPSAADLRSALRLTGRDWVGGHANPELGVILVSAVNTVTAATDLRRSIPHEMAHLLLFRMLGESYSALPDWLDEGLATMAESEVNPNYASLLAEAIAEGNTIQLCDSFPATEERAHLAYAQSVSMIRFIQARYGNRKLSKLLRVFGDGADCQSSVSRVLNTSLADLERAWLRSQQPRPPILEQFSENGIWLLLLLGGFGFARLLMVKPGGG